MPILYIINSYDSLKKGTKSKNNKQILFEPAKIQHDIHNNIICEMLPS